MAYIANPNGNGSGNGRDGPAWLVIRGRSLAHRKLTPRQRASLAADLLAGDATIVAPTVALVARMVGASPSYVHLVLRRRVQRAARHAAHRTAPVATPEPALF
jgi:hypothetical protein